jgi:putative ABC transport system permease protein
VHRIVGIVQDAVIEGIGEPPEPYFYLPYWRQPSGEVTFLVQVAGDAAALAPALKATLKGVDPHLDPRRILTMSDYIDYAARIYRATAALAAVLAGVGLLLTVLGIYGVVAYRTANRTREIGIRVALGARRGEVVRLVMREGAVLAALGLSIGVPAALASTRVLGALVFRVSVWDPPAFGAAAVVLFLSVCAATAIPAWRATRITPSTALRDA